MAVTDTRPDASERGLRPEQGRRIRWTYSLPAAAAAWLVPIATHLLGVDLVLVPVVVVATASVIRTAGTLLDRLMLALFLDCAVAVVAGIGFTFWPWGFQPVAVAGVALSGLIAYAVVTDTVPSLPKRISGADIAVLGTWIAAWYVAAAPALRVGGTRRIAYTLINNDRLHHFNLFDSIRTLGGITMFRYGPVKWQVAGGMGRNYPPGAHYLYALLDSFVMSGKPAGNSFHEVDRYYFYTCVGFAFLAASVAWGCKWIAGPAVRGWRSTLVTATVATFAATGFLTTLVWEGFDSEVVGLAFLALTIAVTVRPPARGVLTQAVFICGGIICVSFSYTLMLLFIVPAVAALAVFRRRDLSRQWRPLLILAVITGILTVLPVLMPKLNTGLTTAGLITWGGFIASGPRGLLYCLVALALAAVVLVPGTRRSPVARLAAITLVSGVLATVVLWLYMRAESGGGYYLEKAIHGLFVLAFICIGTVAHAVRADAFVAPNRLALPRKPAAATAAVAALCAGVLLGGGISWGKLVYNRDMLTPGADSTWARVWYSGDIYTAPYAKTVDKLTKAGIIDGDSRKKPTGIIIDSDGGVNQSLSLITTTLNHNIGLVDLQMENWQYTNFLVDLPATGPLPAKSLHSLTLLEKTLAGSPRPIRVVVSDPRLAQELGQFGAQHPEKQLEVLLLKG